MSSTHKKSLPQNLSDAYTYCHKLNRTHYENFPVASLLLPKKIRPAVDAIYAFARTADDFADEAQFEGKRLELLEEWQRFLDDDEPQNPVFIALQDARRQYDLPKTLFTDLLTAFKQDVVKSRYQNFAEVLDYCKHSANPVGRLVLHLFRENSEENLKCSDAICTALQLTNFWQDIAIDLKKNRIYLPKEDMQRFGVDETILKHFSLLQDQGESGENFKKLLQFQIARTKNIFQEGASLGLRLKGRLGVEIRLTWLTGNHILDKIAQNDFDVFQNRPVLNFWDYVKLFPKALKKGAFRKTIEAI